MKYLYNKKVLFVLAMSLMLISCGNKTTVEPEEVINITSDTSSADISAQIGYSPSRTDKNSDTGLSSERYDTNTFAGHNGQISVYYNEDGSVLYYKWFLFQTDKEKAKDIYSDVCQALTGSYGDAMLILN